MIRKIVKALMATVGCSIAACSDMKDNAREWDAQRDELWINPKPDQQDLPRDPGDVSPLFDWHTRQQ